MTLLDIGIFEFEFAVPGEMCASRRKLKLSRRSRGVIVAFWLSLVLAVCMHSFVINTCPRSPDEWSGHIHAYSLTKYVSDDTVYLTRAEQFGVGADAAVLCLSFLFIVGMKLTRSE